MIKNAVIKEILRISNPLPGRLPRLVPQEGYSLYGQHVPGGVSRSIVVSLSADLTTADRFQLLCPLAEPASFCMDQPHAIGAGEMVAARCCIPRQVYSNLSERNTTVSRETVSLV
jgi:hypothetical protein